MQTCRNKENLKIRQKKYVKKVKMQRAQKLKIKQVKCREVKIKETKNCNYYLKKKVYIYILLCILVTRTFFNGRQF